MGILSGGSATRERSVSGIELQSAIGAVDTKASSIGVTCWSNCGLPESLSPVRCPAHFAADKELNRTVNGSTASLRGRIVLDTVSEIGVDTALDFFSQQQCSLQCLAVLQPQLCSAQAKSARATDLNRGATQSSNANNALVATKKYPVARNKTAAR